MSPPISKTSPARSDSADELRRAAFGGGIYRLLLASLLLVVLAGCHGEAATDLLLAAEREVGWEARQREAGLFQDGTGHLHFRLPGGDGQPTATGHGSGERTPLYRGRGRAGGFCRDHV